MGQFGLIFSELLVNTFLHPPPIQSPALFLTPYIESNRIAPARHLSRVRNLSPAVESYCGLITVDKMNGAHTFFWFFPAAIDPENAPVLLWFGGGPGESALISMFFQHGPFSIGSDANLHLRELTWTRSHSIIYIDQPMDVGYSFIENEKGNVYSGEAVAPNMYSFLVQFFKLFPELQENDFYVSGVSFAGIFAPATAHYIHTKNQENPELRINLKGMLLETPLVDPISQMDYGDYLYYVGLIDEHARDYFHDKTLLIQNLLAQERYLEAVELKEAIFDGSNSTYFTNVTGFTSFKNILQDKADRQNRQALFRKAEEKYRKFLHVGNLTFTDLSGLVVNSFKPNVLRSVKPLVEDLLNWGYKTLIYAGQFDIVTFHTGVYKMVNNLNWQESENFSNANRKIWKVNGTVAGYLKAAKNLAYVLVRNAGHSASRDQPVWLLDLLNKFTHAIPFPGY